jgi:hypothetical protein
MRTFWYERDAAVSMKIILTPPMDFLWVSFAHSPNRHIHGCSHAMPAPQIVVKA